MRPMVIVLGEASLTSLSQPRSSTLFMTRGRTRRTYSMIYGSLLRTTCRPSLLAVRLASPSGQPAVGETAGGSGFVGPSVGVGRWMINPGRKTLNGLGVAMALGALRPPAPAL